jgi:hypothetical protein
MNTPYTHQHLSVVKKHTLSNTTMHEPGLPFHTSERNYRGVSGAGGRGRPGSQGALRVRIVWARPCGSNAWLGSNIA